MLGLVAFGDTMLPPTVHVWQHVYNTKTQFRAEITSSHRVLVHVEALRAAAAAAAFKAFTSNSELFGNLFKVLKVRVLKRQQPLSEVLH